MCSIHTCSCPASYPATRESSVFKANQKLNRLYVWIGARGPGRGDAAQAALVRRVREGQIPSTRLHLIRKLMEQAGCTRKILFFSSGGARVPQNFLDRIYHIFVPKF